LNYRIQKFDSNGNPAGEFINKYSVNKDVSYNEETFGVAVDSSGIIYVSGPGANDGLTSRPIRYGPEYQIYSNTGTLIKDVTPNGAAKYDSIYFPMEIVVDHLGNIYVSDIDNDCINKFDSNGIGIYSFNKLGCFAVDSSNNFYLTDGTAGNYYIDKFDSNGNLIITLGNTSLKGPHGIAIDSSGNIYVVDGEIVNANQNPIEKIKKLDSQGNLVTEWLLPPDYIAGGMVYSSSYFTNPIAVDSSGNVYFAEACNSRIDKYAPGRAFQPYPNGFKFQNVNGP